MSKRKSIISAAVGSAFAVTLGIAPLASAAENPFSMQPMEKGFMVAYGDKKAGEGKCGGELAPLFLDFSFELFPVTFYLIPVHFVAPFLH